MHVIIMFLLLAPVIGATLTVIGLIIAFYSKKKEPTVGEVHPTPDVPSVMPTREPSAEHPDLADQFDGRLTNIVKNPMKGIL